MFMSQRGMWLPICRRNRRGERSGDARKGVTGAGGANDVVFGAASGDGCIGMFENTANGDGELEGTEQEFSVLDIDFESLSFY